MERVRPTLLPSPGTLCRILAALVSEEPLQKPASGLLAFIARAVGAALALSKYQLALPLYS